MRDLLKLEGIKFFYLAKKIAQSSCCSVLSSIFLSNILLRRHIHEQILIDSLNHSLIEGVPPSVISLNAASVPKYIRYFTRSIYFIA